MEREVIVVGAGPSGATVAMSLAQKGHDVLLLDRQSFPRDKTCGDAIPAGAIEVLYSLGMQDLINSANFYPVHRLLLSSPRDFVLEADLEPGPRGANAYVVPRLQFDVLLQQHAIDSGADFQEAQVKEPIVEDGRVVGVRARMNGSVEDIRAKVVIGADGVTSVIARALRPDKHEDKHRAVALRVYVENMELLPNEVEFYLYRGILPGYGWIFPTGENTANIGLGMRLDRFREEKRSLEEMLDIFLELPAIKKRVKPDMKMYDMATWQLNFGSQEGIKRAYNGALLVGDAAGMINPLTGGGIHNSVVAGRLAAEVVDEALAVGDLSYDFLQAYEESCTDALAHSMRRSYFIQRSLLRFPIWVDLLVRLGGSNSEIARTFVSKL